MPLINGQENHDNLPDHLKHPGYTNEEINQMPSSEGVFEHEAEADVDNQTYEGMQQHQYGPSEN